MTVRNYGDPAAEYDATQSQAGTHVRDDRSFLRMYGRDPMRIIQGIVTNDVANAPSEHAVYAAFLTPKGRMMADVRVIRRAPQDLLLDVPTAAVPSLLEYFRRTIPPLFARFEDVTAAYGMIGVYGPNAGTICSDAVSWIMQDDAEQLRTSDIQSLGQDDVARFGEDKREIIVIGTRDTGNQGYDMIVQSSDIDRVMAQMADNGAKRIGAATFDVSRIEAGTPRWGAELDEQTIPLEADLLTRAISTNKGCYTGQEVIIRVLHRGHVNRILRGFLLGDAPTPAPGSTLTRAGEKKEVARITSAAYSAKYGQTIALGYARREIEVPAQLTLPGGSVATVVALPFDKSI